VSVQVPPIAVLHPAWFGLLALVLVGLVVFAWALARISALSDVRLEELSVPAAVPDLSRAVGPVPSSPPGRVLGRGGQRVDHRADAQERAARDTLRCAGARVDVAPVRCPLDRGGS